MKPSGAEGAQPSAARERLLDTAARIFYAEGIHGVGVDRVLSEAGVTRATMYRHFSGKEDLVLAYLEREDEAIRGYFSVGAASATGSLVDAVVNGIADDVERRHTRGCPFINASVEYPDPASRVRALVAQHRAWFRATLAAVIAEEGIDAHESRADALVLLRDAALVGGYLDGVQQVRPAFVTAAGAVLGRDVTVPSDT